MDISILLSLLKKDIQIQAKVLIDSGCTGSSIDQDFVRRNKINTKKVARLISIYNTDGTMNAGGPISEFVKLKIKIQDHIERMEFAVTNLGKNPMFIGFEWLKHHNPSID